LATLHTVDATEYTDDYRCLQAYFTAKLIEFIHFPGSPKVLRGFILSIAMTSACLLAMGCGGDAKAKNRLPVFKVSGKVVYKGQPVTDADVTFYCAEKERSAFGRTNSNGEFRLTTYGPNDGAVAGKHVVMVVKIESAPPTNTATVDSTEYIPPGYETTPPPPPPKKLVPAKYSDLKTSDLFVVVTDDGENPPVELELKD
jgi:hypothetical protein